MNANDFIKEHIKIDNRTRSSKKINLLCSKHKEFARYLELIQKEDVYIILSYLLDNKYICYTMIRDDVKHFNFKKWINYLLVEDFINFANDTVTQTITDEIDSPRKPNVYELSKKGEDFLNIHYVREFMEEYNEN